MDLEAPYEVREKQILHDITYMWNLKNRTNELTYKIDTESQTQKTNIRLPQGRQ